MLWGIYSSGSASGWEVLEDDELPPPEEALPEEELPPDGVLEEALEELPSTGTVGSEEALPCPPEWMGALELPPGVGLLTWVWVRWERSVFKSTEARSPFL